MKLVFESKYYLPEEIEILIYYHIIICVVGIILVIYFRKMIFKEIGIFIFALLMVGIYFIIVKITIISPSKYIHNSLESGTYKVVDGIISDLKPMPKNGHVQETFNINGVKFSTLSLENNNKTMFFNMTKYYGSPIQRNGQRVLAYYIESEEEKLCLFFLPRCIEFGDEPVNKIIKLWVSGIKE